MIELENRPIPQNIASGLAVHLRKDFQDEFADNDAFAVVVDADMQWALVNASRSLPPGLQNANLFFFVMQLYRDGEDILVDVDIELRPMCQAEDEPIVASLKGLGVVAGDSLVRTVHDAAIELYRSRVPVSIELRQ